MIFSYLRRCKPLLVVALCLLLSSFSNIVAAAEEQEESSTVTSLCHGRLALVTGGTGKTGRKVVDLLLRKGYCVRVLTRSETKAKEIFASSEGKIDFSSGSLGGSENDVHRAMQPRKPDPTGIGSATVSHVVFVAGGEDADFEAVNYRGVLECAQEAIAAGSTSMVVVSSAWVSKPYSIASLLFNTLDEKAPMAKHYQGEMMLQKLAADSKLNYVILRAGRLVTDEEYPVQAPPGLWITQSDNFAFFGPAGSPGMSQSQLAEAVVAAMDVKGKYTVEVTSGTTPASDITLYNSLTQDDAGSFVVGVEDVDRIHLSAVKQLTVFLLSWLVGGVLVGLVLGWKWGLGTAIVVFARVGLLWAEFWSGLSVSDLAIGTGTSEL